MTTVTTTGTTSAIRVSSMRVSAPRRAGRLVSGMWEGESAHRNHGVWGNRADAADDYWFSIEADDRFVWWAEVHRNSTPEGVTFDGRPPVRRRARSPPAPDQPSLTTPPRPLSQGVVPSRGGVTCGLVSHVSSHQRGTANGLMACTCASPKPD